MDVHALKMAVTQTRHKILKSLDQRFPTCGMRVPTNTRELIRAIGNSGNTNKLKQSTYASII